MPVGSEQVWDPAVDPVLCSPFEPPDLRWKLDSLGRAVPGKPTPGRRPPLHITVPTDAKAQLTLALGDRTVNDTVLQVRGEVERWRAGGYAGVTATTWRLLHHWSDPEAMRLRPFYAQVEAIETLIWPVSYTHLTLPTKRIV